MMRNQSFLMFCGVVTVAFIAFLLLIAVILAMHVGKQNRVRETVEGDLVDGVRVRAVENWLESPEFKAELEEHRQKFVQGTTGRTADAATIWPTVREKFPISRQVVGFDGEILLKFLPGETAFDWTVVSTEYAPPPGRGSRWIPQQLWWKADGVSLWFPLTEARTQVDKAQSYSESGESELLEWTMTCSQQGPVDRFELKFRLKKN